MAAEGPLLAPRLPAEWLTSPREPLPAAVHLGMVAGVSSQTASRLVNYFEVEGYVPSVGPIELARPLNLLHQWAEP